ncbi:AraC family transcriptional regulator [Pendulispora rubella]|uniref:AraC family transcriptional regulator n=1 Tax=Pendulispora rubella TaxID=2741070 RepID=A0ABZ2L4R3_9BACT
MMRRSASIARKPRPDPLSGILGDLRIGGLSYGRCELREPWGIELPAQPEARFHFVAAGSALFKSPDGSWHRLTAGDVVLVPRGDAHALASSKTARRTPLPDIELEEIGDRTYRLALDGGRGPHDALLFCCSVSFTAPSAHPLIELMPAQLIVREHDPSLEPLLEIMADEILAEKMGSATVLTRLADVVITRVIRTWSEAQKTSGSERGWLAAIRDPKIGRALAAIHREPGRDWSLAALARIAGCSSSSFRDRFTRSVGTPPAKYVARWRMHVADAMLREQRLSNGEVGAKLGYESVTAFTRAFKRITGKSPGSLRRIPP